MAGQSQIKPAFACVKLIVVPSGPDAADDYLVEHAVPGELADWKLELAGEGHELVYEFDSQAEATGVPSLLRRMSDLGIGFKDLHTRQSSLEDIFVGLVHQEKAEQAA